MSIEAKAKLLNELENGLGKMVLAADMPRVMSVLAESLDIYEVEQGEIENGSDDLFSAYVSALEVQGRSAKTIERYTYIINRMTEALKIPTRSITSDTL